MGRQIEYYMELESYKLLVRKAFELGFKVIERQDNFVLRSSFDEVSFLDHRIFFYLEEAGQLVVDEDGDLDLYKSPLVEAGFSYINEMKKEVSESRLWVLTGFWENSEEFIHRDKTLDKKYSSLMRYVKRLAPYTEVWVKSQNPMYDGSKFTKKVYITPFLLEKTKSAEYDCI